MVSLQDLVSHQNVGVDAVCPIQSFLIPDYSLESHLSLAIEAFLTLTGLFVF